jgi:hypothetical protein
MTDLRLAVRAALVRVITDANHWPPADSSRFHNRLLDECGDAARPLVALLVAVMDRGITGRLPAFCATRGEWERLRGALVISLATDAFIQTDMAAWAVDSWAVALGAIDAELLLPPKVPASPRSAARPASSPRTVGVPLGTQNIVATGAPAAGPNAWTNAQRSRPSASHWTQRWPMDRILVIGLTVFVTIGFGAEYFAIRNRAENGEILSPAPAVAAEPPRVAVIPAPMPVAVSAPAAPAAALAQPALDTIKLADGRTIVGRIELKDGREMTFSVAPSVAGRYAVTRELLSSGGDASCEQAAAVIRAALPSEETIVHVPGSSEFTMSSRPGVRGHIDAAGRFETPRVVGEKDGVHYSFRMSGRFTAGGFRAESESITESVVKYRESQSCRFVAALTGTRLP